MNTDTSLESLLNDFLHITRSLEERVVDENSEPEEWIELLDKRQEHINALTILLSQGIAFTDSQKKSCLQPAYEIDLRIFPIMDQKKKKLESEIINLKKSKAANQQYGDYGNSYSPYGAFFDTKK
ncbi:flagellar protein FliT [Paenibacillus sp. FJAT-27812]|uniref:flagellar protein FliT n=1 Tax=Paenibacillus sp. FJAT-27812 TaxID=1684143 RepID=UPI0006A7A0C2|nr:flagellar protein FliT [Paenibacillus sp. FJAT-27812]